MPNVRPINESKYKISKNKFFEAYYFCLQYNEWKEELNKGFDVLSAGEMDGMPKGKGKPTSATESIAIHRAELERKCRLIEQTAMETDPELYPWILKAVTNEGTSYKWLKSRDDIPCGKDVYYDRRRKFYYLISRRK